VQDAAYSSLLKHDRRTLHRLAADTLLALYPDRRRELAAVIAMHFERAGDPAAAAEHFVVAGEHALERFATREASVFFDHAEASLGPDDQRTDLRLRAALGGAKASWTRGQSEAIGRLERAVEVGEGRGDRKLLADIWFWIAFLRRARGEIVTESPGLQHAVDRAAEIGTELGDPMAQALPTVYIAVGMIFSGQLREGTRLLGPALQIVAKHADAVSGSILAGLLTMGHAYLGDSLELLPLLEDASVNLIVTSPPYALHFKKEYGNVSQGRYIKWFLPFARQFLRILKDDGSLMIDIGGAWQPGQPTRSLYHFELLIALCHEVGFHLAQEFY